MERSYFEDSTRFPLRLGTLAELLYFHMESPYRVLPQLKIPPDCSRGFAIRNELVIYNDETRSSERRETGVESFSAE